ncbi:MAG: putative isomerase [Lysobacteraceae bacterium]|nr:MAG: putative isomerase [Xanthomonadaceae bacterium]
MMIPVFQVDAFASEVFTGNPAAVCLLDHWLDDAVLANIARENNLSETAFLLHRGGNDYDLRWFTPVAEVELCGHATLASGYVVLNNLRPDLQSVNFRTLSGVLVVHREQEGFMMELPVRKMRVEIAPEGLLRGLGVSSCLESGLTDEGDWLLVLKRESEVAALEPDYNELKKLPVRGISVTARSQRYDFVSRYFAPAHGINEDPVTGSAHCALADYWSRMLGVQTMTARQISPRGGDLSCEVGGDAVRLRGRAIQFMSGYIQL